MRFMASLFAAAIVGLSSPAMAETKTDEIKYLAGKAADFCDQLFTPEIAECYKTAEATLRDRAAAAAVKAGNKAAPPKAVEPTGADLPSSNPIKLSGRDLSVQTRKWEGKVVQTAFMCFFADKDEFRCIAPGGPRVDFEKLLPESRRAEIERNCDTVTKAAGKNCRVTVQFVYADYTTAETGGLGRNHIVIAKDSLGYIQGR